MKILDMRKLLYIISQLVEKNNFAKAISLYFGLLESLSLK